MGLFNKTFCLLLLMGGVAFAVDIKYSGSAECGYFGSKAMYASFGYEKQLFTCKEAIAGVDIDFGDGWSMQAELAPVYASIKSEKNVNAKNNVPYQRITAPNGDEINVDGGNKYVDWYKNLGNKIYNIGSDFPFRELNIKWKEGKHGFVLGRQINALSFSRDEVIWQEDGWFAPMSYFFSKDLYNGIVYQYKGIVDITLEVMSGDGNPTKNHIYYLNNEGNSNLKSNNTQLLGGNISYNYGMGRIFAGYESTTIGSTYRDILGDGKHLKETAAIGADFNYENVRIYGQWTQFKSGLSPSSSQYIPNLPHGQDVFKEITQRGYFVGIEGTYKKLKVGIAYEEIDRFDYRAWMYGREMPHDDVEDYSGEPTSGPIRDGDDNYCVVWCSEDGISPLVGYENAKQKSIIFNAVYQVNDHLSFTFAYHKLKNPLNWVSHILPSNGEDRTKLGFRVAF